MTRLPEGWRFEDPRDERKSWRAVRVLGRLRIEIEAETRELAIEWACAVNAGESTLRPDPMQPDEAPLTGFVP